MDYLDNPRNKSDDLQTIRFDSNSNEKNNFTKKLHRYKCCLFRIFHKSIDKAIIDKDIIDENIDIHTDKRIHWNICALFK